jgi:hypothetical protein
LCHVDDDSKKVENRHQHDSAKRRSEKVEFGDCCIAKQKYEAEGQQKPGVKQERAVAHCEVTEQRANENKPDTMGPSAMIGDKSPLHSLTCPAISQQRDGVLIGSPARGAARWAKVRAAKR